MGGEGSLDGNDANGVWVGCVAGAVVAGKRTAAGVALGVLCEAGVGGMVDGGTSTTSSPCVAGTIVLVSGSAGEPRARAVEEPEDSETLIAAMASSNSARTSA